MIAVENVTQVFETAKGEFTAVRDVSLQALAPGRVREPGGAVPAAARRRCWA